jgi:hypothetical protein
MSLRWEDTGSYILPFRTACGRYQVACRVGGSRGPVYQGQYVAGVAVVVNLGDPQGLPEDAKALCDSDALENQKR